MFNEIDYLMSVFTLSSYDVELGDSGMLQLDIVNFDGNSLNEIIFEETLDSVECFYTDPLKQ